MNAQSGLEWYAAMCSCRRNLKFRSRLAVSSRCTHDLAHLADCLVRAEPLMDALPSVFVDIHAEMSCSVSAEGAAVVAIYALSNVKRSVYVAIRLDLGVVSSGQHLGRSIRSAGVRIDYWVIAVVDQSMTKVTRQQRLCIALSIQRGVKVPHSPVCVVDVLRTTPFRKRANVVRSVPVPQALVAGLGVKERPIRAELSPQRQPPLLGDLNRRVKQFVDRAVLEKPVAVLAEDPVVTHNVLEGPTGEPRGQQADFDLFHQVLLAAYAISTQKIMACMRFIGSMLAFTANVGSVKGRKMRIYCS